jgi:hypothetical protein
VTGRQGMLTPSRHMVLPLLFYWVRVNLTFTVNCSLYLNWTLILTGFFPVYLIRCTDFDRGLFRLLNLDTLILTFEIGHAAGATGRQEMLIPPRHMILPLLYQEVRVCPVLKFVFLQVL